MESNRREKKNYRGKDLQKVQKKKHPLYKRTSRGEKKLGDGEGKKLKFPSWCGEEAERKRGPSFRRKNEDERKEEEIGGGGKQEEIEDHSEDKTWKDLRGRSAPKKGEKQSALRSGTGERKRRKTCEGVHGRLKG